LRKINYKKIFSFLGWTLFICGLLVSLGFIAGSERGIIARELNIKILNDGENFFISRDEVREFFDRREKPVLSETYGNISINELEKALNAHPAIGNAEVSADLRGELRVSVTQRTPVLRVINKNGESYYIDTQSRLMPLNENYSARVIVASGEIHEPYARRYLHTVDEISGNRIFSEASILDDLLKITMHIRSDSVLSGLMHQIYVNRSNEIELFPSVGNHRIIFGDATDIALKFNKLKLFYTEGLNKSDAWTKYADINLKYKNLVVCTRK
jgi:cell division protein FtsQ